ncbi:MAG: tRNA lysidine(34) synthetase TilS [Gammaproteobacteria bacterium]|nr:tRNA lysidine(34) synthetase TilS [Gammaproteobacteria bacterium]
MKDDSNPQDVLVTAFYDVLNACLRPEQPLCIAYSGGMDSAVLLHVAVQQTVYPLRAIYVDHGLSPEAGDWAAHCDQVCKQLDVPFTAVKVEVDSAGGQGPEAAAREARYTILRDMLGDDEVLLTAHHEQDQMETFLLQMLRGSGLQGLSGMPLYTMSNGYTHVRPMLNVPAETVQAYAEKAGLSWVEDPSNAEDHFNRNFLRHKVLPKIRERWPAAARATVRSARLNAEAAELLDELAAEDLQGQVAGHQLKLTKLLPLSTGRKKNALRYLLRHWHMPVPSEAQLSQALHALFAARVDGQPEAAWPGVRIRRYRDLLWFFTEEDDPLAPTNRLLGTYNWDGMLPLDMGPVRGRLELTNVVGMGISASATSKPLVVRFRHGGERLRPAPRSRTRQLKNLLQESDIVPWMRGHIPLIYSGEQLLAVGDLWVDAACVAGPSETGRMVCWTGYSPIRETD